MNSASPPDPNGDMSEPGGPEAGTLQHSLLGRSLVGAKAKPAPGRVKSPHARVPNVAPVKLKYDIQSWSSFSASYHPRHVMVNKPTDQSSRWASGMNNQLQFITLKLDSVSILHTLTFGKFHKGHVCNLKEFQVFAGLTPDNMVKILHSGLRNDSEPETFSVKWKANDVVLPVQYIKIVPLRTWEANFNFSIWYIEARGICNQEMVEKTYWDYVNYRETETLRLVLKHFRQRNFLDAFTSLQTRTGIRLEDQGLTALHKELVLHGDFAKAEAILADMAAPDTFDEYIQSCEYRPRWHRILPGEGQEGPRMRGGHQMCIDSDEGKVYLYGGWDGVQDLSDFWVYSQSSRQWRCISNDTRRQGGPGPRSCHKICFDPKTRSVFVLGRYVNPVHRPNVNLENDFSRFDTGSETWIRLSGNIAAEQGPELLYDHQMVIDSENQVLYVFGGQTIGPEPSTQSYSGLYTYHIATNRWKLIRNDSNQAEFGVQLKSRIGHSMLFNPLTRELYIFAGQRDKDYLSDFYIYDIDSDTIHEVSRDYSTQGGPDPGFTQRATIDIETGEFYVLSGLVREKNMSADTVKSTFWVYNIKKDRWSKVYQNENVGPEYWASMMDQEPCPRFAHQLVYNEKTKTQFLFGGNPGDSSNSNLRLDDFWELQLSRPDKADIIRRARFLIKRQKFREMCQGPTPLVALQYLQSDVSQVVNHDDAAESKDFRELSSWLFKWRASGASGAPSADMAAQGHGKANRASIASNATAARAREPYFGKGGLASSRLAFDTHPLPMPLPAGNTPSAGLFHSLAPPFTSRDSPASPTSPSLASDDPYTSRTELYERLLEFFPESMREPKGNLVDLVPMK